MRGNFRTRGSAFIGFWAPALCVSACLFSACSKTTEGATLLHWAAETANIEIAKSLVENGTPVDIRDRNGRTPLLAAAGSGNVAVAGYLISKQADIGAVDNAGMSALHYAAREGRGSFIKFFGGKEIREKAAPLLALKDASGKIPIQHAVLENRRDAAVQLLALGSPVDAEDGEGSTVLHWACRNGYEDVVQLLVSRGAPLDEKDSKGRVPIHLAASAGYKKIVEILIKAGADTTVPWPRQTWF